MNCQSTSEQPFEELFIQINRDVKSIERGFRDSEGPDIINSYEGQLISTVIPVNVVQI